MHCPWTPCCAVLATDIKDPDARAGGQLTEQARDAFEFACPTGSFVTSYTYQTAPSDPSTALVGLAVTCSDGTTGGWTANTTGQVVSQGTVQNAGGFSKIDGTGLFVLLGGVDCAPQCPLGTLIGGIYGTYTTSGAVPQGEELGLICRSGEHAWWCVCACAHMRGLYSCGALVCVVLCASS